MRRNTVAILCLSLLNLLEGSSDSDMDNQNVFFLTIFQGGSAPIALPGRNSSPKVSTLSAPMIILNVITMDIGGRQI